MPEYAAAVRTSTQKLSIAFLVLNVILFLVLVTVLANVIFTKVNQNSTPDINKQQSDTHCLSDLAGAQNLLYTQQLESNESYRSVKMYLRMSEIQTEDLFDENARLQEKLRLATEALDSRINAESAFNETDAEA